jgi:hypothetical protein
MSFDEISALQIIEETPKDLLKYFCKIEINELNKNNIYSIITSFMMGKFEIEHIILFFKQYFNLIKNQKKLNVLMDNVVQYMEINYTKDDISEYLDILLQKIKLCDDFLKYKIPDMIWKYKLFRQTIKFEHFEMGDKYLKNGFLGPYCNDLNNIDNYDKILKSISHIINDDDLHETLIDYIHHILISNLEYTKTQPTLEKMRLCCPMILLTLLQQIIFKIVQNKFTDFDEKITESFHNKHKITDYDITDFSLNEKLLITVLLSVKIITIQSIKHYHNRSLELKKYKYQSNIIKQYEMEKETIVKSIKPYINLINNSFILYSKVCDNLYCDDIFVDCVNYIDCVSTYFKEIKSLKIDNKLYEFLSDIMGGTTKNIHTRFLALVILFKLSEDKGFFIFGDIFNNLFKLISQVDFFKWTNISIGVHYQLKIIQSLSMLLDMNIELILKSREIVVGTLFNLISTSIQIIDDFDKICKTLKNKMSISREIDLTLCNIIEIVSITLLFHGEIYKKEILKTVYPEVEEKYGILIEELLKMTTNTKSAIYTIYTRPDLAGLLTKSTYTSINNHINFHSESLSNCKDLIIDNIEYAQLSKKDKDNIIEKLNKTIIDESIIPEEFMDPFTCKLIIDPVKIPDIECFFDKTSILMQIQQNGVNPYTRKILNYDMLIDYNNKTEIIEQIEEFKKKIDKYKLSKK